MDIFWYDLIIIPVHADEQFTTLVVRNRDSRIEHFDSLTPHEERDWEVLSKRAILSTIEEWFVAEAKAHDRIDFVDVQWRKVERGWQDNPRQNDGKIQVSCGFFMVPLQMPRAKASAPPSRSKTFPPSAAKWLCSFCIGHGTSRSRCSHEAAAETP